MKKDFSCDSPTSILKFFVIIYPYIWTVVFIGGGTYYDIAYSGTQDEIETAKLILLAMMMLTITPLFICLYNTCYMITLLKLLNRNYSLVPRD